MATPLSPVLDCTEFVAAEGRYELLQDIFLDQVPPHAVIHTHVSSVAVKYKDYLSNTSNTGSTSAPSSKGGIGGSGGGVHGKQTSADSTLSASNLVGLEEHLKDVKLKDERGNGNGDDDEAVAGNRPPGSSSSGGTLSRNFHGNLVDLPLYNEESSGEYKSPRGGMMSPGLSQAMTPGPPPLKDSTSSVGRSSDPFSQYGPPPPMPQPPQLQQQHSFKSLSRAGSYYTQGQEDTTGSSLPSSMSGGSGSASAGFSSFFSGKRKKPKNNITKTNSTFVAKITTHENLAKILANRVGEDVYIFWNAGKTFTWSDLGQKPNEPLSHISFTKAFPTSHDVNILTRSCENLDVIIGFSTGDIIWFDPLCNKYYRLNKQAVIKDSAVTMIKWLPGSESQFMAAFQDGSILIMDKERDDNAFTTPTPSNDNTFHVTRPKGKHNPISHWQVCKKPITAFAFSPDLQHVAVVSMDGCLRVVDFRSERLLDTFAAYFGALNCVCWSPDGKYILTGGQDDLVTIWSFKDQRIVARCQGHQSYVTGVAFDPWRCDERNYRFGSVGEDAKLILWDFSVSALHKPKAATTQRRGSNATVLGMAGAVGGGTGGTGGYKPGHGSKGSISSLRGTGGHSLFSGLHATKPSTSQTSLTPASAAAASLPNNLHHRQQPVIAEEPLSVSLSSLSSQDPSGVGGRGGGDASSSTSSTRDDAGHSGGDLALHLQPPYQSGSGEGSSASMGDSSSTTSSVYSATLVSETGPRSRALSASTAPTTSGMGYGYGTRHGAAVGGGGGQLGGEDANDAGSSNAVYKKSAHARTLPHLHLHKPQVQQQNHHHQYGDIQGGESKNGFSSMFNRHGHNGNSNSNNHHHNNHSHSPALLVRPPEPRSHVAMLQPLMVKGIHQEPLASITFREDAIMTSDRRGHIKVWGRPPALPH
ncbi:hypothetical protein EDD11_004180 [Mortierella claussenii]|nr:hypothetical protein EDD11_004180 [Mortierella claussenii]